MQDSARTGLGYGGMRNLALRHAVAATVESLEDRRLLAAPVLGNLPAFMTPTSGQQLVSIPASKSIMVPLSATDADAGDSIRYAVSSSNKQFKAKMLKNTTFLKLNISWVATNSSGSTVGQAGSGELVFELFRDTAPQTVKNIVGLVTAGFYDGLTFHRIADLSGSGTGWIIQGGDPSGDGSGGPPFRFQDELSPASIFSGSGQLAMANSGNDTNGSQFFVTTGPVRHLDYNHTIFGQMVQGWDTLAKMIDNTVISRDLSDKPAQRITINSASVVTNKTDGVMVITAPRTGTSKISVTATDSTGNVAKRTFSVRTIKDTTNAPPFITSPKKDVVTAVGKPVSLKLRGYDAEGDAIQWNGGFIGEQNGWAVLEADMLTVVPYPGYRGAITLQITAQQLNGDATKTDSTTIIIGVGDKAVKPKGRTVFANVGKDTGLVDVATFTNGNAKARARDFSANINWGSGQVAAATIVAGKKAGTFIVRGRNSFNSEGTFPVSVNITSKQGATARALGRAVVYDAPLTSEAISLAVNAGTAVSTATNIAKFNDTDPQSKATDFTATIDWGNGQVTEGVVTGSAGAYFVRPKDPFTYSASNTYLIKTAILDKGGSSLNTTTVAYIGRTTLQVNAGADITSTGTVKENAPENFKRENQTFNDLDTTYTGTYSAIVDYGDGAGFLPLGLTADKKFTLNHTYKNSGTFVATVVVKDANGAIGVDTVSVLVSNVVPVLNTVYGDAVGVTGQDRTVSFSASDDSPEDTEKGFTYSVTWGDGTSGTFNNVASASHAYAAAGEYAVKVTARDKDSGTSTEKSWTINIVGALAQPNPTIPGVMDLLVSGTADADRIDMTTDASGQLLVRIESDTKKTDGTIEVKTVNYGPFNVDGQIRVYGRAGNDRITIASNITRDVELYGEAGNDTLQGGAGNDILVGGAGDDLLEGNGGRDLPIGGAGKDRILGGADQDLVIGASLKFESSVLALRAYLDEWTRTDLNVKGRLDHLLGKGTGLNGKFTLEQNMLKSDAASDVLYGNAGQDVLIMTTSGTYADRVVGREKADTVLPGAKEPKAAS